MTTISWPTHGISIVVTETR